MLVRDVCVLIIPTTWPYSAYCPSCSGLDDDVVDLLVPFTSYQLPVHGSRVQFTFIPPHRVVLATAFACHVLSSHVSCLGFVFF